MGKKEPLDGWLIVGKRKVTEWLIVEGGREGLTGWVMIPEGDVEREVHGSAVRGGFGGRQNRWVVEGPLGQGWIFEWCWGSSRCSE